jgi:ribosomal protein S18 acetylase RimI-like enzyme
VIRPATAADVEALALIHAAALPGDFLPGLGQRYLRRLFYPTVLTRPDADLFVLEKSGGVVAFALFVADSDDLSSALAADWPRLIAYASLAVVRRPSMARVIVGQIRGFDRELDRGITGVPELYLIASTPHRQSQGLGGSLLEHGLAMLRTRGQDCVVKTSSAGARRFYERHGFERIGSEHRPGRVLDVLLWSSSG